MIHTKIGGCIGLAAIALAIAALPAAAEGWPSLTLNPFKQTSSRDSSSSSSNPLNLPGTTGSPGKRTVKVQEPSTWQKFSSGTKRALTKTKETLFPWSKKESPSQSMLERYTVSDLDNPLQPKKPKSTLASWFSGDDEEDYKKPQTVTDFLKQPRPK